MPTAGKSLYTPVFYGNAPSSSASTSMSSTVKTPSAYLDQLSRTHIALAHVVKEVPGSPASEQTDEARIERLRGLAQQAFESANGNPADGKWGQVVNVLKMGVTRGHYLFAGARADGEKADGSGLINARTEAEWVEWEKKRNDEVRLNQKVQWWQQTFEPHLPTSNAIVSSPSPGSVSVNKAVDTEVKARGNQETTSKVTVRVTAAEEHPKEQSSLGFPVVKRASKTLVGKPKGVRKVTPDVLKSQPSHPDNLDVRPVVPPKVTTNLPVRGVRSISDIPETSFLPPSFPSSQLITSTPVIKPTATRHQPDAIPPVLGTSSLQSPRVTYTYGRSQGRPESSSLPDLPSTPTRPSVAPKRNHSPPSSDRALKRARTMPSLDTSNPLLPPKAPVTPPLERAQQVEQQPPLTPKPQVKPTLNELLASSKKTDKTPKLKSRETKDRKPEDSSKLPSPPPLPIEVHNPYLLSPYRLSVDLAFDDVLPAKSLSSLAGSDSESEADENGALGEGDASGFGSFKPMFSSTQVQFGSPQTGLMGTATMKSRESGTGYAWGGYNSQFDVDRQVDQVDKILEKDVDYDGWLREPTPEREGSVSP